MKKNKDILIKLVFYRTLFSQSGASITMGSIAAYLRELGYNVELCFLARDGLHNTINILKNRAKRTIIIAKPNFKDYVKMFPILKECKKQQCLEKVYLCGPYASLNAKSILKENIWIDGVINNPVEQTAGFVLEKLFKNRKIKNTPQIKNLSLNDLPYPARDIEKKENGSYINLEMSRGCVFNCSFCHIPLMQRFQTNDKKVDIRKPQLVVTEMIKLYKNYNKTLFIFNDSCFWRNENDNKIIDSFCSEIKKSKLDIKFYVYLRCNPFIGEEYIKKLNNAGLTRIFLGIENAVERSQRLFNKPINYKTYEEIKKILDENNINVHIGYITFEPYSTLDNIFDNIKYLYKIKKLFRLGVILEPVRIIPGTNLHKKLIKDGLMSDKLKYNEITYGYKFLNESTGVLLKKWQKIFFTELSEFSYKFEYYCTTAELLRVLCIKNKIMDNKIQADFVAFNSSKEKSMKNLRHFFINSIKLAKNNFKEKENEKIFIENFKKIAIEIEIKYANIISKVNNTKNGSQILNQIYSGKDQI